MLYAEGRSGRALTVCRDERLVSDRKERLELSFPPTTGLGRIKRYFWGSNKEAARGENVRRKEMTNS